jgi:peroxiredoxin
MQSQLAARTWMKLTLAVAGIYNLAWGAVAVLFPGQMLSAFGVEPLPIYPQFWQCIGMIVGVYGVGYLIASRDPHRHWPIVLVGLLGKVFGPVGFLISVSAGALPASLGLMLLTNDFVWWIPFGLILFSALRYHQCVKLDYSNADSDSPLRDLKSQTGQSLDDLAADRPQLVVFLRHAGCTFCRETLADLARARSTIESFGAGIVFVHLGNESRDAPVFERYGLGDLPRVADPQSQLYRLFGLDLGSMNQLLGPKTWMRAIMAGLIAGHGAGPVRGNAFQMPGIYVFHCGQVVAGYQHRSASDRPDYLSLIRQAALRQSTAVA